MAWIFIDMMKTDTLGSATEAATMINDVRLTAFHDPNHELGRAMATAAGYGLLDKPSPPFVVAPVLAVTKANVAEGWRESLHRAPHSRSSTR